MERMKQDIKYVSIGMYKQLEEENKKLKEKVRFLEECLDRKEKLNEEYRKQIDKYKRQYEHSLGWDDELIYEEWLYD